MSSAGESGSLSSSTCNSLTTMTTAPGVPATNGGGKVKRTRNRQRLSCVECTKRRQKCDRKFPCGLCVSRGIPNLCRWEPIVVRPTPQRPPTIPPDTVTPSASATIQIQTLTERVAALEKALAAKQAYEDNSVVMDSSASTLSLSRPAASTPDSTTSGSNSGVAQVTEEVSHPPRQNACGPLTGIQKQGDGPQPLIDINVQLAAVALAQLSLAPRTEYLGAGTVVCAIHKLGDPESFKFPYPSSCSMTRQVTTPNNGGGAGTSSAFSPSSSTTSPSIHSHPARSPIRELISHLPPRNEMEDLLDSFFATRNAEYGLSESWFKCAIKKMWHHLDLCCTSDCALRLPPGCPACQEEVNPHWLALLFSVLAISPRRTSKQGMVYFNQALMARRLVDDILLASVYSTSEFAVHGGVLSCLAVVFLSSYLADRGRVSEAWKMCGNALRSAQALGLHRDPRWRKWETMGQVESDLRILTWWLLASFDRLYSFILGRPVMAVRGAFELMPTPPAIYGDGSPNPNAPFQREFIQLSDLISEAASKLLSFESPSYAAVIETDRRFQEYEAHIPPQLSWRVYMAKLSSSAGSSPTSSPAGSSPSESPDVTLNSSSSSSLDYTNPCAATATATPLPVQDRFLCYQRVILAAWYLDALMNIHRPYLMHPPPILPVPGSSPSSSRAYNPSRERCIELAIELTRTLLHFYSISSCEWLSSGRGRRGGKGGSRKSPTMFEYFLFDGAVALAGALSQVPPHPQASECLDLMDGAMRALEDIADASSNSSVVGDLVNGDLNSSGGIPGREGGEEDGAEDGEGETARRGIRVLVALRKAGGWGMGEKEKGELVSMREVQEQQREQYQQSSLIWGSGMGVGGNGRFGPLVGNDGVHGGREMGNVGSWASMESTGGAGGGTSGYGGVVNVNGFSATSTSTSHSAVGMGHPMGTAVIPFLNSPGDLGISSYYHHHTGAPPTLSESYSSLPSPLNNNFGLSSTGTPGMSVSSSTATLNSSLSNSGMTTTNVTGATTSALMAVGFNQEWISSQAFLFPTSYTRPTQNTVLPYEILQSVQPSSSPSSALSSSSSSPPANPNSSSSDANGSMGSNANGTNGLSREGGNREGVTGNGSGGKVGTTLTAGDFDLDWVKLAGMENWYSGAMSFEG